MWDDAAIRHAADRSRQAAPQFHLGWRYPRIEWLEGQVAERGGGEILDAPLASPEAEMPPVAAPVAAASPDKAAESIHHRAARYGWALLLARIYDAFPLLCSKCGGEMKIIAFISEAVTVRDILAHLGEPISPPRMAPARGPSLWEVPVAGQGRFDPQVQAAPDYEFDQRIAW